mmetsp:Transcript_14272/g.42750  ORF Transcript_14272/g.42750 Transcript_14272/m.42750 type:complete len:222 (-) Transcript_14272:1521-2186(-)
MSPCVEIIRTGRGRVVARRPVPEPAGESLVARSLSVAVGGETGDIVDVEARSYVVLAQVLVVQREGRRRVLNWAARRHPGDAGRGIEERPWDGRARVSVLSLASIQCARRLESVVNELCARVEHVPVAVGGPCKMCATPRRARCRRRSRQELHPGYRGIQLREIGSGVQDHLSRRVAIVKFDDRVRELRVAAVTIRHRRVDAIGDFTNGPRRSPSFTVRDP